MTNIGVTTKAGNSVASSLNYFNVVNDVLVTSSARAFRNTPTAFLYLDRLVEFAGGKREGMKKAMIGLGEILWDQTGWRMTIIASCRGAMTGLYPAVKVILHNVTIGAGPGIVAEIGSALGINERVGADAEGEPEGDRNDNTEQPSYGTSRSCRIVWPVCFPLHCQ
jgi:hypothetical protein